MINVGERQWHIKYFPVWLRNRLISSGLEPVLYEYKNVQHNIKTSFVSRRLWHLKASFNHIIQIVHFYTRGKLFIMI